jgi:hypothetical protein
VEGGPGAQDEAQLLAHRPQHNLLLMVADRSSDEAVPDVRVRISDDSHQPGLDRVLSGSWLLVNLPGGSYEIDLKHHGRLQRQPLSIGPDERAALVFYVDAAQPASD